MSRRLQSALLLFGWVLIGRADTPPPPSLAALAQTERAFAARCREVGIRDSFLQFFSDEAIVFTPDPTNARERLSKRPSVPFAERQLTWEPRLGDVAKSGDLGWLTGPAALLMPDTKDPGPHEENYLSVWRRQPSGQWRVIIDVGVGTPAAPAFEPGFHRFPMPDRYTGANAGDAGTLALAAADRALNGRLAAGPMAEGYAPVLLGSSRLHRNEIMPLVGRTAILDWMRSRPARFTGVSVKAESAGTGDLGYSYGSYQVAEKDKAPESGHYVRLWQRRDDGTWFVVVDVTRPKE